MSWFKEGEFWKEWSNDCNRFDKSIEDLMAREVLIKIWQKRKNRCHN